MNSRILKGATAAGGLAIAALTGCATPNPYLCPPVAVLADAARLTMMRPGAPADLSGELFSVVLTNASTDCHLDRRKGETDSSVDLTFKATRVPAADGAS